MANFVKFPEWDGVYINVDSIVFLSYKMGVLEVKTLDGRAYSTPVTREQFEDFAWKVL